MTDVTIGSSGGSKGGRMAGGSADKTRTTTKAAETNPKGDDVSGGIGKMVTKIIRIIRQAFLPATDIERRVAITQRILDKQCDRLNAKQ